MRIGRAIITRTILALGAAGSILAGSAIPVVASQAPAVTVLSTASHVTPNYYHVA
jgi:hypothetical protein